MFNGTEDKHRVSVNEIGYYAAEKHLPSFKHCGDMPEDELRISEGIFAELGEFPWIAVLFFYVKKRKSLFQVLE